MFGDFLSLKISFVPQEVDRILDTMEKSGEVISVETNTSAIKGYSHAGDIQKAVAIFESMCGKTTNQSLKPNVRTLNTLLRGCLWAAATLDGQDKICGGVVSSEAAWKLYLERGRKPTKDEPPQLDVSSYEYSISLLCQALRANDAEKRIEELKQAYGIVMKGPSYRGGNQSAWESLAISYLALARAKALLGQRDQALEACNLARPAMEFSKTCDSSEAGGAGQGGRHVSSGGMFVLFCFRTCCFYRYIHAYR